MLSRAKVLCRVLVLRRVAAADVAARQARAQVHPRVAERDALLANVYLGRDVVTMGQVFAKRHRLASRLAMVAEPGSSVLGRKFAA